MSHSTLAARTYRREAGVTLIETIVAAAILLIGVAAVMGVFSVSVAQNGNQGEHLTRATEYAQDKMEQLLALNCQPPSATTCFNDGATDTTKLPVAATGGTGLGGAMAASTTVGSVNPAAPSAGYVDYLGLTGNLLTSSTGASYVRQWRISTDASGNLKTIAVLVRATSSSGQGAAPSTVLVSTINYYNQ